MGRRSILSLSGLDWITRFVLRQDLRMRTNLTDDHKIITLWPAESISRGDRSRLPFRRIWQSTRPNFLALLSTPAFPDTSENIFEGAQLSVTGIPSGVTASFKPQSITNGQTALLTLTAPANQPIGSS